MEILLTHQGERYRCRLDQPIDISIPLRTDGVNCFYAPLLEYSPVVAGDFIGSTAEGGPVNFMNVRINPHGNGTHTECVGHIAKESYTINKALQTFHTITQLVSIYPARMEDGDRVITKEQMQEVFPPNSNIQTLIIRTMPNDDLKLRTNYSGANPPYVHHEAISYLVATGVQHLLLDLPSVDRESDGGALLAHKAFWNYPENPRTKATITELIYVPNTVWDGMYLLNIQIASFEIDVSPSKPVLYILEKLSSS